MASPDVRLEAPADHAAIHAANVLAFGRQDEANLVAALRDAGALAVSCVAYSTISNRPLSVYW